MRPAQLPPASPWRRLAAFGLDYLVISAYLALLTALSFAFRSALHLNPAPPSTRRQKLTAQVLVFATLTAPVALYFALSEASSHQATLGKRTLGLRVTAQTGQPASLRQTLLRAAIKLAPWEIAHTALWQTQDWSTGFRLTPAYLAGFLLSTLTAASYVLALFTSDRRTPYDRIADTRVVRF